MEDRNSAHVLPVWLAGERAPRARLNCNGSAGPTTRRGTLGTAETGATVAAGKEGPRHPSVCVFVNNNWQDT
jgi:hypothetical protein